MALIYGLAAHICMPLSGKPSRAQKLLTMANEYAINARTEAANISNEVNEVVPDWIAARGYGFTTSQQFFYPYGSLLTLTAV
jgi:hypothetical protein